MKRSILSLMVVCCASFANAQTLKKCASREAITYQEQFVPNYGQLVDEQFNIARNWSQANGPTRTIYTIPVVFHVVYNIPRRIFRIPYC